MDSKTILLYPVGTDSYSRNTYAGIEFPDPAAAFQHQDKVQFNHAVFVVNGTVYSATKRGALQAELDLLPAETA